MNNQKTEKLKFLVKRFLDFSNVNNWTLSQDKETMSAYEQCLKEIAKFEEGERSKKSWMALEAQMVQETPEMDSRYTDLRQKIEELNEIAKRLDTQVSSILEEYTSDEYNVKNIQDRIQLVVKIGEYINTKGQEVGAKYPKVISDGRQGIHPMGQTFWRLNMIKELAEETLKKLEGVIAGSHHKNTVSGGLEHIVKFVRLATEKEHDAAVESIEEGRNDHCKKSHAEAIELIQDIRSSM